MFHTYTHSAYDNIYIYILHIYIYIYVLYMPFVIVYIYIMCIFCIYIYNYTYIYIYTRLQFVCIFATQHHSFARLRFGLRRSPVAGERRRSSDRGQGAHFVSRRALPRGNGGFPGGFHKKIVFEWCWKGRYHEHGSFELRPVWRFLLSIKNGGYIYIFLIRLWTWGVHQLFSYKNCKFNIP